MYSPGWKYFATFFAAISSFPVFCYWYYSLPSVVDRFSEKLLLDVPPKDTSEFHKFMGELAVMQREKQYADLLKKAAEEEQKRGLLK